MNRETQNFYNRVGQKYADWQEVNYLHFKSIFDEVSWLQFSKFLPSQKDLPILDAGCGGGGWSLRLAKMGYNNLTLIDFSTACINGAKRIFSKHSQTNSAKFYVSDIANLPFEDQTFKFIFCESDPLQYCIENQDAAFRELVRVLSKGSVITLSAGTGYYVKQKMLSQCQFSEFFEFEETGVYSSDEGKIRPFSRDRILYLFRENSLQKMRIAGRLTISDLVGDQANEMLYSEERLKEKIIDLELKYQDNEEFANFSSHIFAAGKK